MKKGGFSRFHTHLWGGPTRKKPTPLPAFRTPIQKHENNPFLHFFEKHPHSRAQTSAATLKKLTWRNLKRYMKNTFFLSFLWAYPLSIICALIP